METKKVNIEVWNDFPIYPKKRRQYPEHDLQVACLKWFKLQYPHLSGLIFHIPNERKQSEWAGVRAKQLGTLAGVADVFLSVPSNGWHGYYFEFKSAKGILTESQKTFMGNVLDAGYNWKIIRNFEDFKNIINNYLK